MQKHVFFAYGTNISKSEMEKYCDGATLLGYGLLKNYTLEFRGFDGHAIATLIPHKDEYLPVAVWQFTPDVRFTIDNYETFPYLYKREKAVAIINGKKVRGFVYNTKQQLPIGLPDEKYLEILKKAYKEAEFDTFYLDRALEKSKKSK